MKLLKIFFRTAIIFLGFVIAILLLWRKMTPKDTLTVDYGSVQDFSLTDQTGTPITKASLIGHPWVANFIFTRCMGPCPMISYKTSQLQKEIPASSGLRFVSFSVDPSHDKPEVLKKYGEAYAVDPTRWHMLTGDKKDVYGVIRGSFKLAVEPPSGKALETDFVHSTFFVLVDPTGHIRGYYNSTEDQAFDQLKQDLKKWM